MKATFVQALERRVNNGLLLQINALFSENIYSGTSEVATRLPLGQSMSR